MSKRLSSDEKDSMIKLYLTGKYSCATLGKEFGVSNTCVNYIMKNNNIKILKSSITMRDYTLNQNYFDVVDTEDKAYFLGLLYADGHNNTSKGVISIALQESDVDILNFFNMKLNHSKTLYFRKDSLRKPNYKNMYRLDICNRHMSEQLSKLGCVPRKSLILTFPTEEQVPSHLIRHFIRGYFDGDGCVTSYFIKTRPSIQFGVNIVGTENICIGIKNIIKNISNCTISKPNKNGNNCTKKLSIGGNKQILSFLSWLYKDATVYLNRKYQKYIELSNFKKNYE